MAFAVSTFQSALAKGGARPSLFQFDVTGPPAGGSDGDLAGDVAFFCSVSELPGLSITPIEKQYFGRTVKIAGDMVFADLTTTIYSDESHAVRTQIEKWMAMMNTHESNRRGFAAGMGTEGATATLKQFGKSDVAASPTPIYTVTFTDIFPHTLGEIALSYDTASDIEQFDVTWGYQYWNHS
jgi:hypothetical protein